MPIPDRHPGGITIDVAGADRMALNLRVKIKKARVRVNVSRAPLLVTIMLGAVGAANTPMCLLGLLLKQQLCQVFLF